MPVFFNKYNSTEGTFITIGIKDKEGNTGMIECLTEEEFLIMVETVKLKKPGHVVSMDGK